MTPTSGFVTLGGLRLHYLEWGAGGPPVVLLHGLASSCRIWDFVAPALAERFHVIALDQRSHGLSDRPDSDYTFDEVTADLAGVIQALGIESPALVGHSWGASVALCYAAGHPGAVSSAALVDGGAIDISALLTWDEAQKLMMPPHIDGTDVETFLGFANKWPHFRAVWSPQFQDVFLAHFQVENGKVYRRLSIENHMKVVRALYNLKPTELYPAVTCPVLIVPAMSEPANDREKTWQEQRQIGIETALTMLPRARVQPMVNTAHDIPVLRPRELADALVAFLSEG